MKRNAIFVILILVFCTVWTADAKELAPELKKGDILLCNEYTYRTVKNTSRTVYQIARLGFTNVKSFQDANGLKADGVIGPKTQQKSESEFNKQFNLKPQKYTELNKLSLSVSSELTDSSIAVIIIMRNESEEPLRIVGRIAYDVDGNFLFRDPILTLVLSYSTRVSTRKGDRIACGSGPLLEVMMCAKDTMIKPSQQVSVTASIPKLEDNQSGALKIGTAYINSTLSTGVESALGGIPEKEEK